MTDDGVVGTIPPAPEAAPDGQLEQFTGEAMGAEPEEPEAEESTEENVLVMRTPEERLAVKYALEGRRDLLKSTSRNLVKLHKPRAAQDCDREDALIHENLLSQVGDQAVMVFNERETLPQVVARVFQGEFRSRVRGRLTSFTKIEGESHEDAAQKHLEKLDEFEELIGTIGDIAGSMVVRMLTKAADSGYQKGLIVKDATPSAIAREALQAMNDAPSEE